jgi:hypothetical protein
MFFISRSLIIMQIKNWQDIDKMFLKFLNVL